MLLKSLPKPPMPALDKVGLTGGDVAWDRAASGQSADHTQANLAQRMQVPDGGRVVVTVQDQW